VLLVPPVAPVVLMVPSVAVLMALLVHSMVPARSLLVLSMLLLVHAMAAQLVAPSVPQMVLPRLGLLLAVLPSVASAAMVPTVALLVAGTRVLELAGQVLPVLELAAGARLQDLPVLGLPMVEHGCLRSFCRACLHSLCSCLI
jgi:hypothetical protein